MEVKSIFLISLFSSLSAIVLTKDIDTLKYGICGFIIDSSLVNNLNNHVNQRVWTYKNTRTYSGPTSDSNVRVRCNYLQPQELTNFIKKIIARGKTAVADLCATMDRSSNGQPRIAFTGVKKDCAIGTNDNDLLAPAFNSPNIFG